MSSDIIQNLFEKKYKEIVSYMPQADADVIRAKLEQAFHEGKVQGEKSIKFQQSLYELLPFSFVLFCLFICTVACFLVYMFTDTGWQAHVHNLNVSHQEEMLALTNEIKNIKKFSNESQDACIDRLLSCELTKQGKE